MRRSSATASGARRELARVAVDYENMVTRKRHKLNRKLGVQFSSSRQKVAKSENREVMVAAIEAMAVAQNRQAVTLRDQGKVEEARNVLLRNARALERHSVRYRSKRLKKYSADNLDDAANLDGKSWNRQRKSMRRTQHALESNQSY